MKTKKYDMFWLCEPLLLILWKFKKLIIGIINELWGVWTYPFEVQI